MLLNDPTGWTEINGQAVAAALPQSGIPRSLDMEALEIGALHDPFTISRLVDAPTPLSAKIKYNADLTEADEKASQSPTLAA